MNSRAAPPRGARVKPIGIDLHMRTILSAAATLTLLLGGALGAPSACAEEYVIGIFTPRTGSAAKLGGTMRNGIALALEEAEDRGHFREGVHLSLKDYDDNAAPEVLAQRTEKLVRDNEIVLVIGPVFSTHAEVMAQYANRHAFPMLTPAVSAGVTDTGTWAFRSGVSPYRLIEDMTRGALSRLQARKVAVVYPAGNAGFASQAASVSRVVAQAGRLLVGQVGIDTDEQSFTDTAAALRTVSPDVIFFCMDAEPAGVLASRLRRAGVVNARLVFGPPAAQPALLEVGRQSVENALVVTDYLPELAGAQNKAFVAAYTQRFGKAPDRWAGLGYATGLIAAEAIRNAGPAPNRASVRAALERGTSFTLPLGQSKWTMDLHHEPRYAPAFFTIRGGAFAPLPDSP